MELKIDFECTECQKILPLELDHVIPGEERACSECNQSVVLTDMTLRNFASDLRQYCEH